MIYIVRQQSTDFVKIGYTDNMMRTRLTSLQVGNPTLLVVIALYEGSKEVEKELHIKYAEQAVRGEWFTYSDDMLELDLPIVTITSGVDKDLAGKRRATKDEQDTFLLDVSERSDFVSNRDFPYKLTANMAIFIREHNEATLGTNNSATYARTKVVKKHYDNGLSIRNIHEKTDYSIAFVEHAIARFVKYKLNY